jgi:membrane fusion protein, multidrug efflux system
VRFSLSRVLVRPRPARTRSLATAVLALGVGLAGLATHGCEREAQRSGFTPPPLPVETARVAVVDLVERFSAVGSVTAREFVTVVAEIDAIVQALPFGEGQALAAGAVIAQLDDVELKAQVARAEAVAVQRRAAHDRVQRIVGQGAGAPQDLDDARAALQIAVAELDLARARLTKTRITAPFTGQVGRRLVSPGAYLRAGTPIVELVDLDALRINFSVPERLLGRLQPGVAVQVTTIAHPDLVLTGTVDVIDPVLDEATRSARVLARVPNPDHRLRPGMSADVSVVLDVRSDAMTVPGEAVFAQGGQTLVFEVQPDSTVVLRPVALGLRQRDRVEILRGLEPAAVVVRAGHQKLSSGQRVLPLETTDEEADAQDATPAPGGEA